jgi:endoglycosylceramidase
MVLLRGINISGASKVPPYLPLTDASDLDPLPAWGFNAVRLLFTWEAWEAEKGVTDESYLQALEEAASEAWSRNLYVIIDFHQDGFSRYLAGGCGDGFPPWAIPEDASLDTPDNGEACESWGVAVAADTDVHEAFTEFYSDSDGVRTAYLELMGILAERFGAIEGVIGYDLINEPWGLESSELSPLYEDAAEAIRAVHPDSILFIEGHASTNSGAIQTDLAEPSFDNFVYAPHFYEGAMLATHLWSGLSTATDLGFFTMDSKADEWGVPLLVGEFGTHADTIGGTDYVALQYTRLDDYLANGTQWNYTPGWTEEHLDGWNAEDLSIADDQGQLRDNFQVRPQPRRFAGEPAEFSVSESSVTVSWLHESNLGETRIFLPSSDWFGTSNPSIAIEGIDLDCSFKGSSQEVICSSLETGQARLEISP